MEPRFAAIYLDFENAFYFRKERITDEDAPELVLSMLRALKSHLRAESIEPIIVKAYADFDQLPDNILSSLYLAGADARHVMGSSHKNAADMRLCIDVMDTFYTRNDVRTFVVVAGDRDYIPVIRHIQEGGRSVRVCAFRGNASGDLLQVIGEEAFLDAALLLPDIEPARFEQKRQPAQVEPRPSGVLQAPPQPPAPKDVAFAKVSVDLTDSEKAALAFILAKFGHHSEVWLTPLLRELGAEYPQMADYERREVIARLKATGAIAVVKRAGEPYDYSVALINYNHPIVRELNPG